MSVTYIDKERRPVREKRRAEVSSADGVTLYRVELRYRDRLGRSRRRREWVRDLDEARMEELRRKGAAPGQPDRLTWGEALRVYEAVRGPSESTARAVRLAVDRAQQALGPRPGAVARRDMGRWMRALAERTSPRNANKSFAYLRAVANAAFRQGELPGKPAWLDLPHLKERPKKRTPFDPAELPKYLDALHERVRLPVLLCAVTGLRIGAVCDLDWSDVDARAGVLHLHSKGRDLRLPVTDPIRDLLGQARRVWERAGRPTRSVFFNRADRRWEVCALDRAVRRAWDRAGLPRKTPHELRHMMSTEAGRLPQVSARDVQALLGHASLSTTDLYTHADLAQVRRTLDAVWRDTFMTHFGRYFGETAQAPLVRNGPKQEAVTCPHCGRKFFPAKQESPQAE